MKETLRFENTLRFMGQTLPAPARLLDLGPVNSLSEEMMGAGYTVTNTGTEDLDFDVSPIDSFNGDAVTAFEIFEHMVNPFGALRAIKTPVLFASVPLKLWFAPAYRNMADKFDQHYHEFEPWQFDFLLEKAGWEVVRREKWIAPTRSLGFRPLLRKITPRFYMVEARRFSN